MNPQDAPAYGLWPLVLINAAVFIFFALSFTKPRTARDWRSFGALRPKPGELQATLARVIGRYSTAIDKSQLRGRPLPFTATGNGSRLRTPCWWTTPPTE